MGRLFTAEERNDILNQLNTFFRADEQIVGLVLVGSSAKEISDQYSGLDLLVVVRDGAVFTSVYRKWKERLSDLLPIVQKIEKQTRVDFGHLTYLLENYLEVNLFFSQFRNLKADRQPWRILFDSTEGDQIAPKLEQTYQTHVTDTPQQVYRDVIGQLWQPVLKCVTALNRQEVWRTVDHLNRLRSMAIQLAALNYELDFRHYVEVDQLPEMLLIQLRHTLPTDSNQVALRRALMTTLNLLFMQAHQLEKKWQIELIEPIENRLMSYVEAFAS